MRLMLNLPDRIIDGIAGNQGWASNSGIDKEAFVRKVLIRLIKDQVQNYEAQQAVRAASTDVESLVIS